MIFQTFYGDGTTVSESFDTDALTYTHYDTDGTTVLEQREIRPTELQMIIAQPHAMTEAANKATLHDRAAQALSLNAAFLALPDPVTLAQAQTQIKALTRECSALIRLALNLLDDVSDS